MKAILGRLIFLILLIVGIVALVIYLNRDNHLDIASDQRIDITPAQIRSIEQIGQWEFLSVNDEELVDTIDHGFITDRELARIYYGTLRLGINLQSAEPGWISSNGDTIVVKLPPIQLLDKQFIDEARTRSFFESGSWKPQDLEQLYKRAYYRMVARSMSPSNIAIAEENAKAHFTQLLRSMGFTNIKIETHNARDSKPNK